MRQEHSYEKAKKAVNARNLLILLVGGLMVSNLLLAGKVMRQRETVILTPSVISRTVRVVGGQPDEAYLELMLVDVMALACNITPDTAQQAEDLLLKMVHPSIYGAVKTQLDEKMAMYRQRGMSSVFYFGSAVINAKTGHAQVSGILDTFIGKQRVTSEKVTYAVGLDFTGGKMTLTEFARQ